MPWWEKLSPGTNKKIKIKNHLKSKLREAVGLGGKAFPGVKLVLSEAGLILGLVATTTKRIQFALGGILEPPIVIFELVSDLALLEVSSVAAAAAACAHILKSQHLETFIESINLLGCWLL